MADLEHAVGVRLLDRHPRGVEATVYGCALLKRTLAVFDELKQGIKEIESLDDPSGGAFYGGSVAGPVFREVAEKVAEYLGIEPQTPQTPLTEVAKLS